MADPRPISLIIALRCTRLGAAEAVAIAGQIADALADAPHHGGRIVVPSFGDVRLHADGKVTWAYGRQTRPEEAARLVARLLTRLLRAAEQAGERVPAALKYSVGRAVDERAPAPLASLDELRGVLGRFEPQDRRLVIGALVRAASAASTSWPLGARSTIADVRRARRDRGVTLASISGTTGIPVSLLRELEWGLFDNWRGGTQTQEAVRAYAEAAGLDSGAVVAIVLPHLDRALITRTVPPPAGRRRAVAIPPEARPRTSRSRRSFGILMLVALVATVAWWLWATRGHESRVTPPSHAVSEPQHPAARPPAPSGQLLPPDVETPKPAPAAATPTLKQPAPRAAAAGRQTRRVARAPQTRAARSTIWNRPLLILKVGKPQPEDTPGNGHRHP